MDSPPGARRRITGPDELLEREAELGRIAAALRSAANGSGAIVVVEGAAGIGKSTLLAEAAGIAAADGMTVLRARSGHKHRVAWATYMFVLPSSGCTSYLASELQRALQHRRSRRAAI